MGTVPLRSRANASPFWIMLLLSSGTFEREIIEVERRDHLLARFWPTCCSLSPRISNSPPTGVPNRNDARSSAPTSTARTAGSSRPAHSRPVRFWRVHIGQLTQIRRLRSRLVDRDNTPGITRRLYGLLASMAGARWSNRTL